MRRTAIITLTCSFRARYPSNASTISSGIISTGASLPLDALERDRMDGWHYAMLDGTQPPLFYKHPDKDTFVFSYFGTPDTFRIAVYDDSQQKVNFSEVMSAHSCSRYSPVTLRIIR